MRLVKSFTRIADVLSSPITEVTPIHRGS
jgi:hypothetical protein